MALKWLGCFAALAASAGLAVAQPPIPVTLPAPGPDAPPPAARPAPAPVVLAPPPAAPAAAPAPCEAPCFDEDDRCDEDYRVRAHADYLLWFLKNDHVPVLFGSIPAALDGVTPLPPGSILPVFGGAHDSLDYKGQSGARFGVEGWIDPDGRFGIDADYFQLEHGSLSAGAVSSPNGLPILGPTYFNPVTGRETILLFSEPGLSTSNLALSSATRFWGVEANVRTVVPSVFSDRTEFLVGFRHVQFDQSLDLSGSSIAAPGVTLPFNGNPNAISFRYQDSFWVHDRFYGPQIGVDSESTYRRLFLDVKAKFAAGVMDETVHVNGATTFLAPAVFTVPGGVLAQRSNIGARGRTVFAVLPEVTVNTGVQLTPNVRIYVGYNLIYIDRLQRVGPTIDGVDNTQVPALQARPNVNANRPFFQFSDGRFWAQGLNTGLEFRY